MKENKVINIDRLATLSRLELDSAEKQRIERDLRALTQFAGCLEIYAAEEADMSEACAVGLGSMREDVHEDSGLDIQVFSDNSRVMADGYFTVPVTVETGET